MSRTEIRNLMKQGLLPEALLIAQTQYGENPVAQWTRLDLAWVYDAICKKASSEGNLEEFKLSFLPLLSLNILQEDSMLYETICWRLRALIAKCSTNMDDSSKAAFIQEVWEFVLLMPKPHPSEACSVLCKAIYQNRVQWSGFTDFMEWWGWETFRKEDFECEKMANGKRMPISLAEGCHIACAKILLQTNDKRKISSFVDRLKALNDAHPEMLYPGFYTAKLLLASGGSKVEMLAAVLPFVRQKVNEFWAWQILADVEREDEMLYLACLLRAVNCKAKDAFLVKVYYQLAYELISRHDYIGAKLFLQRYIKAKEDAQSRLPSDVCHWMSESWYNTDVNRGTSPTMQIDYKGITDLLLYADIEEQPMCVTYYDSKSGRVHVVKGYQQQGTMKVPHTLRNVKPGMLLMVRLDESRTLGEKLVALTVRVVDYKSFPKTEFLRCVEGRITTNSKKSAWFVQYKKEFAYIPNELVSGSSIKVGEIVLARMVLDYQRNKSCWSWRCIEIDSNG